MSKVAKPLQVQRPATLVANAVAHRLPPFGVSIEVAVFKLDSRAAWTFGDEANLNLAGSLEI